MPRKRIEIEGVVNPTSTQINKARLEALSEALQNPERAVVVSFHSLSQLLGISHQILVREVINKGGYNFDTDPNKSRKVIITGADFQKLRKFVLKSRATR